MREITGVCSAPDQFPPLSADDKVNSRVKERRAGIQGTREMTGITLRLATGGNASRANTREPKEQYLPILGGTERTVPHRRALLK